MRAPSLIRFSVFELDLHTRELRKHGVRLKLQDQPFRILQALLERPGELVTREELRQRIWGGDTFVDFDQGLNRAVNKLREVLGDGAAAPRFIETLPRRGYRFIAPVAEPNPMLEPPASRQPRKRFIGIAAGLLLAAGAGLWWRLGELTPAPPEVVALTTFTGTESHPTFSPDGKQIAFAWDGEKQDNTDIYVKVIGEPAALQLTTDPGFDGYPAWSPDGRQIAFASTRVDGGIYVISAVGGPERKVSDLATSSRPAWSPDSKFLLVAKQYRDRDTRPGDGALFVVPVENGGDPHEILSAPPGSWYKDPAYSPDGHRLAYSSCRGSVTGANCTLEIIGIGQLSIPSGTAQRITGPFLKTMGVTWSPDASSLIYSSVSTANQLMLWRVGVRNPAVPERLQIAGTGASYPATDFKSGRLAFSQRRVDSDIWRLESHGKALPLMTSSRLENSPQISTDGRRIAFASGREGESMEIWGAGADGTGLAQITRLAKFSGTPRWSPDGRRIAFDVRTNKFDIWAVEARGRSPEQLTHGPGDNVAPSWSGDGRWIYFASNGSGRWEIWRIPRDGGGPERITRNGGFVAFESADGKALFYTLSDAGTEGLFTKPLPAGEETQLISEGIGERGFAVFPDGIYYLHSREVKRMPEDSFLAPFQSSRKAYELRFYAFATRRIQTVELIDGPLHLGLAISPDRRTYLFTKVIDSGSDLMLIEHFR